MVVQGGSGFKGPFSDHELLSIFSQKYELEFACLHFGVIWGESSGGLSARVLSRETKFSDKTVRLRIELW